MVVNQTITRGYDYVVYEVWHRFDREENEWGIDPFADSPYNYQGAIAVAGEEGLPAVFNSTGENAIGMYFRDSINGPRGKRDNWFGNESWGEGFM